MTTSTPEKADGLKALNTAIEKIKDTIQNMAGIFTMQMAVRASPFHKLIIQVFHIDLS